MRQAPGLLRPFGTAILLWLIVTSAYAALYVRTQLALPPVDRYARTWEFQLMAFAVVRLPWLLLGLVAAMALLAWRGRRLPRARGAPK